MGIFDAEAIPHSLQHFCIKVAHGHPFHIGVALVDWYELSAKVQTNHANTHTFTPFLVAE